MYQASKSEQAHYPSFLSLILSPSLPFFISFYLSMSICLPSLSLSFFHCLLLSHSLSLSPFLHLFLPLYVYLSSFSLSFFLSLSLALSLSLSPSLSLCVCP